MAREIEAFQIDSSAVSLSPTTTHTWNGAFRSRLPASATPTPIGRP